jgi:importin subunit beta-1
MNSPHRGIHPSQEPHVIQEKSNQILTAVVQGMRKEETCADVRVAGTTALLNALEFVKANFEKEVNQLDEFTK